MIVWLASYPRSGNSLVRTILRQSFGLFSYSMYNDVHDLGASKDRARLVGHVSYSMSWDRFYQIASAKRRYVFVKTHDPPFDDAPAIYIVRDGRSAIVSYRHYLNTFGNRQASLFDVVLGDTNFGSWSEHIERWRPERRAETFLLRYEDIVADPDAAVAAIADRFGISALKPFRNPFDHQRQEFPEFFRRGRTDPELKEFDRTAVQLFSCLHGAMMSRLGYRSSWGDGPDALRQFILQQRDLRRKREKELGAKANELETHKKAQAELCKELGAKANELETHKKAQAELCKELSAKANELRQTQTQLAEIETSTSFQVGRAFVDALVRPFPGVLVFPSRLARIALHRKQKRERKLQEALQHVEGQVQQAGRQSVISVGDGGISRAAGEAAAWPRALERLGIPDAALLHQSPYDRGLRVYRHEDRVYKIAMRPLLESSSRRARDLRGEFDLLRRNRGVRGLPEAIDFHRAGDVEAAVYAAVDATTLAQLQLGWRTTLSVMLQLAAILARLSLRGISHNDILPQNVLVGEDGRVHLLDFDQATTCSIYRAILRNYLGLRIGVHPVFGSWTTALKTLLKKLLSTSVARATGRLRSWRSHEATGEVRRSVQPNRVLPALAADASEAVKLLHRAWRLGQQSDANWPGAGVAYYSMEFEGYRFPGERPWSHRWECLRQIIDYKSKRIVELGCNMGLLSCSLLREAGASAALCVDGDAEILEAAR
ncbi:MAG: sulfotransferase domain-containing protein, partial [Hyphomicrobium sp.]